MADKKISELTEVTSLTSTDNFVIARATDNYKTSPDAVKNYLQLFGALPVRNLSTGFASSGNVIASPIGTGEGYWTAWEYTGPTNSYTLTDGRVITGVGGTPPIARTNVDVCSQKMVMYSTLVRAADTGGVGVDMIIGAPSTDIASFANNDCITLQIRRLDAASVNVQFFWETGLSGAVALTSAVTVSYAAFAGVRNFFISLTGGLLSAWSGTAGFDTATKHLEASLPLAFLGADGTIFPRGRRGGFRTYNISSSLGFWPAAFGFQTFA